MPSNTAVSWNRRRRKTAKAGKKRKRKIQRKGSTPKFPIHG